METENTLLHTDLLESSLRLKPYEAQRYRKRALWVSWISIIVTLILAVAAFSEYFILATYKLYTELFNNIYYSRFSTTCNFYVFAILEIKKKMEAQTNTVCFYDRNCRTIIC